MQDTNKFENLLTNVSLISKKYDDIAKITGENFNIFSVMQMESNERYTHSAIIGELLNPKGSHGQGSVFLQLFFEEIKELKCIENYNFDNSKCIIEQHIGTIDVDYTKGGFIDIVLKDDKNVIVIENKIYASDQRNQLKRYKNYYPNSVLLYLNLNGDSPSKDSTLDLILDKDFHIISYQNEITNWLEKCQKETYDQPILRETVKQYLNLVKKLTNQTINDTMSKEIKDLIKSNIKSASGIYNNYLSAKFEIGEEIRNGVIEELIIKLEKDKYSIERGGDKFSQIWIYLNDYRSQSIPFGIESFNGYWGSLQIGIIDFEQKNKTFFDFYRKDDSKKNQYWIRLKDILFNDKEINFDNLNFLDELISYNKQDVISSISSQILEYVNDYNDLIIEINKKTKNL